MRINRNLVAKPVYIVFLVLLFLNFYIYSKGAQGPYIIDDHPNLIYNNQLLIDDLNWESIKQAATSSPASPFYRPLSMLSFAANYSIAGNKKAYSIKITNIVIHVLIGAGIFILTILLLNRSTDPSLKKINPQIISLLVTGLWLFHPLFVSTVLYAVQRMAMLSTFFIIYGCIFYIVIRQKIIRENKGLVPACVGIVVFTGVAFLSKENGALFPGFILLIEYFFFEFNFHKETRVGEKYLLNFTLFTPVIFIVLYLFITYVIHYEDMAGPYPFTYTERLLTQSRIMWHYVGWLTLTNPEPVMLYHDEIVSSHNLVNPLSTLFSIFSWVFVIVVSILLAYRRNIFAFFIIWFLWGHVLESSILPLALIFEHRNYLPSYGLLLGLVFIFIKFIDHKSTVRKFLTCLFSLLFVYLVASDFYNRVEIWKDSSSLTAHHLKLRPTSSKALLNAAHLLAQAGDYTNAMRAANIAEKNSGRPDSALLVGLSIQCELRPDKRFDEITRKKISKINFSMPTVSIKTYFRKLVVNCIKSRANHDFLMGLYKNGSDSSDSLLKMTAFYGLSTLSGYRDTDLAIQFINKAIQADNSGRQFYPYLDELQKLKQNPVISFPEKL